RWSVCSIVEQPMRWWSLTWGRAREPVSFLPLAMRGVARREGALSGFRRTARSDERALIAGSLAHMTRAPASLDAPRGISGFTPSTDRSDRPAVLVPREGSPPPPGDVVYVEPRSRVPLPSHDTS